MKDTLRIPEDATSERFMAWGVLTLGMVAAGLISIGFLCHWLLPEATLKTDDIIKLFRPVWVPSVAPEPEERAIFLTVIGTLPVIALGAGWLARRWVQKMPMNLESITALSLTPVFMAIISSFLGYWIFILNPFVGWIMEPASRYGACWWALLFCIGWLGYHGLFPGRAKAKSLRFIRNLSAGACIVIALVMSVSVKLLALSDIDKSPQILDHVNGVFYPVSQACAGKQIMVDFSSLYGLYPAFLKPWFAMIGLSVESFSLTMAALMATALLLIYWVALRLMYSRFLFCVFVLSFSYLTGGWHQLLVHIDPYFQYCPVRVIFPALFLAVALVALKRLDKQWCFGVGVLTAVAAAWNLDSGCVLILTWIAVLACHAVGQYKVSRDRAARRAAASLLGASLAGVAAGILICMTLLCLQAGQWLPFQDTFRYQSIFYHYGLMMLPMPLAPHPWMAVAFVYAVGTILSLRKVLSGKATLQDQFTLLLSIMGIGLFSYYQGRSHDYVLTVAAWPSFLLGVLLCDRLVCAVCDGTLGKVCLLFLAPWIWVLFVFALIPILSFPQFVSYGECRWDAMHEFKDTSVQGAIRFIRYYNDSESVVIFSQLQGIYYAETELGASLPRSGYHELHFKDDETRLIKDLRSRQIQNIFMDGTFAVSGLLEMGYEQIAELPEADLVYYRLREKTMSDWLPLRPP